MNWATVEANVVSAVQEAAGSPSLSVFWLNKPQGWRAPVHVKLQVATFTSAGPGEVRQEYDADADQIRDVVYLPGTMGVQVTVESQAQSLADSSLATAETIRAGIWLPASRAILKASGISLASQDPAVQADFHEEGHGRMRSAVVWNLLFNVSSAVAGAWADYFETVTGTYTLGGVTDEPFSFSLTE